MFSKFQPPDFAKRTGRKHYHHKTTLAERKGKGGDGLLKKAKHIVNRYGGGMRHGKMGDLAT